MGPEPAQAAGDLVKTLARLSLRTAAPSDVWSVPTVELQHFLLDAAQQLAVLVGPLHDALSGRQPALPPIDQIDCALLALGAALDGVRHWRRGGGLPCRVEPAEARALWEAHDASCKLIPQLRFVALAKRRGDRRPWLTLGVESLEEAMGALLALGLLSPRLLPSEELLAAWREAEGCEVLDLEAAS
jgi:hypothetical protein